LIFILFYKIELKVVVDEDRRKIGVIPLTVAIDDAVPAPFRRAEGKEKQQVNRNDDPGGVLVEVFHG
jgi:hypothetical protein